MLSLTRMNRQHLYLLSLMALISSLFLLTAPQTSQAADSPNNPTTTKVTSEAVKKTTEPTYPGWVSVAVVGTPYTVKQFVELPLAKQLYYVEQLHPNIDPNDVKNSYLGTTVSDVNTDVTTDTTAATSTFSNFALFSRSAIMPMAAAAATPTYKSEVDLAPASATTGGKNTLIIPFKNGTDTTPMQDYINIGDLTASDLSKSANFTITTTNGDLVNDTDFTISADKDTGITVDLKPAGIDKIKNSGTKCYEGNKFSATIVIRTGYVFNYKYTNLNVDFNIWLPDIDRTQANINSNTNLQLRYSYGPMIADSQPMKANSITGTFEGVDKPNFNIVDTSPSAINTYKEKFVTSTSTPVNNGIGASENEGVRVYTLFNDFIYQSNYYPMDSNLADLTTSDFFYDPEKSGSTGLYTTTPLLFGNTTSAKIPTIKQDNNYYGLLKFDTAKHIHMAPSAAEPNLIELTYDGYIKNQDTLDYLYPGIFSADTDPLSIKVHNTLSPTEDNQSMAINESVTNTSNHALTNFYFTRRFDTMSGYGPVYDEDLDINRYDNVPIYFGPQASTGPRAGKVSGLYFRPEAKEMNYTIDFNFNYTAAPDGWSGTKYKGATFTDEISVDNQKMYSYLTTTTMISDLGTRPDINGTYADIFKTPNGNAQADWPYGTGANEAAANHTSYGVSPNSDSAISMKWSPTQVKSQVGDFEKDKTFDMTFNVSTSTAAAPRLQIENEYLRIKPDATKATISGSVSDLDDQYVNLYYTIDDPVTPGDGLPNDASTYLSTVDLGPVVSGTDHNQFTDFEADVTGDTLTKLKAYQAQGHKIYIYAVDGVTDTSGTRDPTATGYISNIMSVRVNDPINVTVNRHVTKDGNTTTTATQLLGYAGDTYNLYDDAENGSVFEPDEATLVAGAGSAVYADTNGAAPKVLTEGEAYYTRDETQLPSEAERTGTFKLDQNDLKLDYYYNYDGNVAITAPALDFGKHPKTISNGIYNLEATSGANLVVTDTTQSKAYDLQVVETTPLTSETNATLDKGLGYRIDDSSLANDLTTPVTVYTNNSTANTVDISNTWKVGDTYDYGPVMNITNDNRSKIDTGIYDGTLTWTVVKSVN
ncbi:hypothetical protein ACFQ5M_09765 [Agrilactobacillus yilanensis]|uniref:WxL domain-containing protein n=1 Tax=Agrilactobacillus yilanensis TaxID=2485997 RepID=A0ABW4J9M4_9LACO|nr:hypothetical protein [Agrilactobacillus yilanensis]